MLKKVGTFMKQLNDVHDVAQLILMFFEQNKICILNPYHPDYKTIIFNIF